MNHKKLVITLSGLIVVFSAVFFRAGYNFGYNDGVSMIINHVYNGGNFTPLKLP